MLGMKERKNRNIKGLQISQDAAKPGTIIGPATGRLRADSSAANGSPRASTSSGSYASVSDCDCRSSGPSTSDNQSLASRSSSSSSNESKGTYTDQLSEQLATLEIGLEVKLDMKPEDIVIISELGAGNGGTVSKARHLPTGLQMARKVVHIDAKPSVRKQILRELQILHDCNSPYIVSFYGAYLAEPTICLCMEFMDKGSLDSIYKKIGPISPDVLGKIAFAVVTGLFYLYDAHRIIHRDVKPSNVLVNSAGQVKICDFGVSGELINSIADTFVGTSTYMSPERIQGAPYSVRSDTWSLGITLIELALGRFPFAPDADDSDGENDDDQTLSPVHPSGKDSFIAEEAERRKQSRPPRRSADAGTQRPGGMAGPRGHGMSILELLQHVVNEPAPTLPAGKFPREIESFIGACLEKVVEKRPTPKQLLVSPITSCS
ncbi:uncharacterized protein L969DRAFT_84454 [Mixia osmundae IAM 14324]|uniref:uncharacterized protein n=1 Tax=Mixia osmundae (strain CBS 9802 / IAM 14324 / JCM 22182 / KY 12970) TaxID=764103 RepID=UPI0004A5571F|nr:uncharacterized protein L969DRAFT_84454 [Mixia osmundae IAM 14324]KEI42575.1 hypothetical protein L969DRAFT_84454 [Mixia osmundae IAM 14324]